MCADSLLIQEIHLKLSSLNKGTVCNLVLAEGKVIPLAQLNDCTNFLGVCMQVVKDMDFVEPAVVLSVSESVFYISVLLTDSRLY